MAAPKIPAKAKKRNKIPVGMTFDTDEEEWKGYDEADSWKG